MDSIKASGFAVLFVGVAVLIFTFYNSYLLLTDIMEISLLGDLMAVFGEALSPLIQTCIRAIYLGIMGWIGSILTRRGVQTVTLERKGTQEELQQTIDKTVKVPAEPIKVSTKK